jgi:hypothetical protein
MKRNSERSRPTPSPPTSTDLSGILESTDVGEHVNVPAVAGHGGFVRVGDVFLAPRFVPCLALPDAFDLLGRRIEAQRSFAGVEDNRRAVGELESRGFDAGDRRDIERPCKDGDVRRGAAAHRGEADDATPIHRGGVGRCQIFRDENRTFRIGGCLAMHAGEQFEDTPADVAHIVGALRQEFIAQRGKAFRMKLRGILPRKRGAFALRDR